LATVQSPPETPLVRAATQCPAMGLGAIELRKRQPFRERLDPSYSLTKFPSQRFSSIRITRGRGA